MKVKVSICIGLTLAIFLVLNFLYLFVQLKGDSRDTIDSVSGDSALNNSASNNRVVNNRFENNDESVNVVKTVNRNLEAKQSEKLNNSNQKGCLEASVVFSEYDSRRDYEASYGSFSQSEDPTEMPAYWNYSVEELQQMALIDDVQAKYFLGVKMLFQAFGLDGYDNYFELPSAFEVDGKMVIQKTSSYFFGANGIEITTRNESRLTKAREMLYQAAVDGFITGMSWHIVSYDMERAYLEQTSQLTPERMQKLKENRLVSYAVLQHPFESNFGAFDLRPRDIEFNVDEPDNKVLIERIRNEVMKYDLDRSNKGLARLFLEAYPKEWDELNYCE